MSDKNEQAPAAHDDAQLTDENLETVAGGLSLISPATTGPVIGPTICFPAEPIIVTWEPMGPEIILTEG